MAAAATVWAMTSSCKHAEWLPRAPGGGRTARSFMGGIAHTLPESSLARGVHAAMTVLPSKSCSSEHCAFVRYRPSSTTSIPARAA